MTAASVLDLSVIIPVKNEEESVAILAREVASVLSSSPWQWECLFVDDGSSDGTLSRLKELHDGENRIRFISLNHNHGQTAAMLAGFREAQGQILATMDGDGQNDPRDLPVMVKKILEGQADLVNGRRAHRHDSALRKISSRIGNGFRNRITGETISDVGCSIRVFRRECVANFPPFEGLHRFFPTLVTMQGFTLAEVPVNHRPRQRGTSKYGIRNRLWKGMRDTLAVRWMKARMIDYRIADHWNEKERP